jgi:cytochrome b561
MSQAHLPQRNDYAVAQKIVHWLMAFLIMVDLAVAQKFGGVMEDWDRFESRSDHAGAGTLITLMLILRLYLRWRYGAPALPVAMPVWQQKIAYAAHWLLYALIGLLIASGIIAAMAANSVIEPFGLFALNDGIEGNFTQLRQVHEWVTWALIGLIGAHIIAALYHFLWLRDKVTQRMMRFWRSS